MAGETQNSPTALKEKDNSAINSETAADAAARLISEHDIPEHLHDTLENTMSAGDPAELAEMDSTDINTALRGMALTDWANGNVSTPVDPSRFASSAANIFDTQEDFDDFADDLLEDGVIDNPSVMESLFSSDTPMAQFVISQLEAAGAGANFQTMFGAGGFRMDRAAAERRSSNEYASNFMISESIQRINTARDWAREQYKQYLDARARDFDAAETETEKQEIMTEMYTTVYDAIREKYPDYTDEEIHEAAVESVKVTLVDMYIAQGKTPKEAQELANQNADKYLASINQSPEAARALAATQKIEDLEAFISENNYGEEIAYYESVMEEYLPKLEAVIRDELVNINVNGTLYAVSAATGIDPETGYLTQDGEGPEGYYYFDDNLNQWVEITDTADIERQIAEGRMLVSDPDIDSTNYYTYLDFAKYAPAEEIVKVMEDLNALKAELAALEGEIANLDDAKAKELLEFKIAQLREEIETSNETAEVAIAETAERKDHIEDAATDLADAKSDWMDLYESKEELRTEYDTAFGQLMDVVNISIEGLPEYSHLPGQHVVFRNEQDDGYYIKLHDGQRIDFEEGSDVALQIDQMIDMRKDPKLGNDVGKFGEEWATIQHHYQVGFQQESFAIGDRMDEAWDRLGALYRENQEAQDTLKELKDDYKNYQDRLAQLETAGGNTEEIAALRTQLATLEESIKTLEPSLNAVEARIEEIIDLENGGIRADYEGQDLSQVIADLSQNASTNGAALATASMNAEAMQRELENLQRLADQTTLERDAALQAYESLANNIEDEDIRQVALDRLESGQFMCQRSLLSMVDIDDPKFTEADRAYIDDVQNFRASPLYGDPPENISDELRGIINLDKIANEFEQRGFDISDRDRKIESIQQDIRTVAGQLAATEGAEVDAKAPAPAPDQDAETVNRLAQSVTGVINEEEIRLMAEHAGVPYEKLLRKLEDLAEEQARANPNDPNRIQLAMNEPEDDLEPEPAADNQHVASAETTSYEAHENNQTYGPMPA